MRLLFLLVLVLPAASRAAYAASDHYGQVVLVKLPVPGATVIATRGETQITTVSDLQGVFRLAALADGEWTIRIEMPGFSPSTRIITITATTPPSIWELTMLPLAAITTGVTIQSFQRTPVASPPAARLAALPPSDGANEEPPDPADAQDGLLINGSVNNAAASPFAQPRAFGNNRPGQRSLYNGGFGLLMGHSAWDARPFSFGGSQTPKPEYRDVHVIATFGGPIRIPRVLRNGPNTFIGYQRTSDHNAITQSALVPTLLERGGQLSGPIVDPVTGLLFPGNAIPQERISPQAAALLRYYPAPNVDGEGRFNFERPVLTVARQDNVESRLTKPINARNQLSGTFAYQRAVTDTTTLFGFEDASQVSGVDTAMNWSHRFSQFLSVRLRYQLTRITNRTTPHFANRTNVSGEAGITGNSQDPINWGPPSLVFASGLAGLSDAAPALTRTRTDGWSAETLASRGRHYLTTGGGLRRHRIDILSQQDPRGTFSFTGTVTGSDLADFLLGFPQTSALAFGNEDKLFRSWSYDAYTNDDWRLSPGLTITAGIRWEYETPITERFGRLVNLDIASNFSAIAPVVATDSVGVLTGQRYPASLVRPDRGGVQPRVGLAWRPVPGSSFLIRAGYGIYRNTSVYQPIATQLAQQPPLSTAFSVESTPENPLTLANGFVVPRDRANSTFAVDPDFRVGYAHNWQAALQRDLPASLTMVATYLGTKGSHLMQQVLPNTYPAGVVNPCASCPAGFVYLTSTGRSSRHAGQFQLRRRLRNGLTASVQYTLSKALDDAAAFSGAALTGASIAQDWLNPEAEYGPSAFDQRHLVTAQFQYTTGIGVAGGGLLTGLKGRLVKGWTFTSQLTSGSGAPFTPIYLTSVRGTGVTGTIRADRTGAPLQAPPGFYLNPAAYAPPGSGHWGTAGRNSSTGPAQFSLNAGVSRTFPWGERLNLDWRIDATNVLNHVTYATVNALVGSPQFGLPTRANAMRKLQTSLRLRF